MALHIDPKVVSLIVGAVEKHPDGATLNDILVGFPKDTVRRVVQRWVTALVDAGKLHVDKSAKSSRYFLAAPGSAHLDTDLDTAAASSVQIGAGAMSTSPGTGSQPANQDIGAPDLDKGHVQIAGGSVHIPAAPVSTSGQGAGIPAHVDKAGKGNVQIGSGAVSTSCSKPAPASESPKPAAHSVRKARKKPAADEANADTAAEASMAELAKSAIETVMGSPTPATATRRNQPTPGVVDNSMAKSASRAVANLLAKSVDPLVPASLRPLVKAAALFAGAMIAIGIFTQASTHPWIATGLAIAVIAGVLIFAVLSRKSPAAAESPVAKSASAPDTVANSASAQTVGGALRPDGLAVPPAPDPNFSVSASQRFSVSRPRPRPHLWIAFLALACLTVIAALAASVWIWRAGNRPSRSAVSAWLVDKVAPLPVRVAAIDVTYLTGSSEVGWTVRYDARIETTEPLYQPLNTVDYLRKRYPNEIETIQAAEKLIGDQGRGTPSTGSGPRASEARRDGKDQGPFANRLAAMGAAPTPALKDVVLIAVSAAPSASTRVVGEVTGWRERGVWKFQGTPVYVNRKDLAGETKTALTAAQPVGSLVLTVNTTQDLDRLNTLLIDQAAYAAKVQAAAAALAADLERERLQKAAELERERQQKAADLERERQQKLTALNQLLQRGTFLSGVFVDSAGRAEHPVLLEVTTCSAATHQITMLLRNTSGWYKTRSGQGDWSLAADDETVTAKVRFSSLDRIVGAGAPLDDTGSWYLTLHVHLDGTVDADPITWDLHCVADADVAGTKAEFGFAALGAAKDQGRGTKESAPKESGVKESGARSSDSASAAPTVGARSPRDSSADRLLNPDSSHPDSSAANDFSIPAFQFFSVSTPSGAYVYSDGVWLRLPENGAKAIRNVKQVVTRFLENLSSSEDRLAGKSSAASKAEVGEIRFDGIETVPVVPAKDVLIMYVGRLEPYTAADVARHPELKDYPIIELAPEKTLSKGVRYASLYPIGGFLAFGTTRVTTAIVEKPSLAEATAGEPVPNLTLFRATAPLQRGQYAVSCGPNSYEVRVE